MSGKVGVLRHVIEVKEIAFSCIDTVIVIQSVTVLNGCVKNQKWTD